VPEAERWGYDPFIKNARTRARALAFQAALVAGAALPFEELVRHALEPLAATAHADSRGRVRRSYPAGLSQREVEVLVLVAQGMTDVEVAEKLVLSPRTVNAHLTSVYNKLGVNSRAAATRLAIEHKLV
jgi:DNA-binding CsgD family transcriptional regulator